MRTRWERLNGPGRIAGIDLARGLAVVGMFAAHLLTLDEFDFADAATWPAVVEGRSSILFATLAGVSIGIVSGGRTPVAGPALRATRRRLAVRAFLLWILGVLLIATGVPVYVILPAYALLFLLALPLLRLSARVLLPLAAGLAVAMPFVQVWLDSLAFWSTTLGDLIGMVIGWHYPFTTWVCFVIAGIGLARLGLRTVAVQLRILALGTALAVVGYALAGLTGSDVVAEQTSYWGALWTARPHSTGLLEVIGSGGFAIAVIGACLLVCRGWRRPGIGVAGYVALPLRAVGSMPLTAYTAQLVAWAIVAGTVLDSPRDLYGFRALEPFWPMTLATIVGCTAWALLVGRGPVEWAVDRIVRVVVPRHPVGRLDK